MTTTGRILILATAWGFALCANAVGQEKQAGAEAQSVQEEVAALRADVASVQAELKALREDMKTVLAEVRRLRATQAKPPRPQKKADTTVYNINAGSSPIKGPKDAPVTIVEFVDLQCPFCIREYPKLKQVLAMYPDKARLVFKHFPLGFHKQAKPAHAATEFARIEGGDDAFWKMHDMIVAKPKALAVSDLRGYAETLGLDLEKFDALMADPAQIDELLKKDMAEARKCKVSGTPTILINGLKLANRKIDGYKARIDEILKGADKKAEEKK